MDDDDVDIFAEMMKIKGGDGITEDNDAKVDDIKENTVGEDTEDDKVDDVKVNDIKEIEDNIEEDVITSLDIAEDDDDTSPKIDLGAFLGPLLGVFGGMKVNGRSIDKSLSEVSDMKISTNLFASMYDKIVARPGGVEEITRPLMRQMAGVVNEDANHPHDWWEEGDDDDDDDKIVSFTAADDLDVAPDPNVEYELNIYTVPAGDTGFTILHKLVLCYDFHPLEVLERIPRYKHLVNVGTIERRLDPLYIACMKHISVRRLPLIKALLNICEINDKLFENVSQLMIPDLELYTYLFEIGMKPACAFTKLCATLTHYIYKLPPESIEAYEKIYELYISHGAKYVNYHVDRLEDKINGLSTELDLLRKDHQTLIDHVKLMPGGVEYFELEKSFKDRSDKQDMEKFNEVKHDIDESDKHDEGKRDEGVHDVDESDEGIHDGDIDKS